MTGRSPVMAALDTHLMKLIAGAALTFAGYVTGGTVGTGTTDALEKRIVALENGTQDRFTGSDAREAFSYRDHRLQRLEDYVDRKEGRK